MVFNFANGAALPLTDEEAKLPRAPKPVTKVAPKYPQNALAVGAVGDVTLVITVASDGRVQKARVGFETPPGVGFGDAAQLAVQQWVFPAGYSGAYTVQVRFRLAGDTPEDSVAIDSGTLTYAVPTKRKALKYPREARKQGIEGWVDMVVQIDDGGRVTHAVVFEESTPGRGFDGKAYESVIFWRFGDNPPGAYKVRVDFKLDE